MFADENGDVAVLEPEQETPSLPIVPAEIGRASCRERV